MEFEGQNLFEEALRNGINLFLGAGFSILAKDKRGTNLPLGSQLSEELKSKFNISGQFTLGQVSSIIEKTKRKEFYDYLIGRFTISDFPENYYCINNLNIKGIYTTNIDNLVHKIFEKSTVKYLNDVAINGSKNHEISCVDYSALHGSVLYPDRPFIFDVASISNTYSNSPRAWNYLSSAIERLPTLFWGYSLSDSSVIQALTSRNTIDIAQKDKWIILRKEDKSSGEYYKTLGFKIIISDTLDFLQYLNTLCGSIPAKVIKSDFKDLDYLLKKNLIPKNAIGLQVRPIKDFFLGSPPIWSDIYSKQLYQTSYFSIIKDKLFSKKKNILVLGTPVSGKTTLLMQLAAFSEFNGIKLIFNNVELTKAQFLARILEKRNALIFIDNLSDSIEAFNFLTEFNNIKVIGFERSHNYEIISHLIDGTDLEVFNITELSDKDIQSIYDNLPSDIRQGVLKRETSEDYEKDSIFEFISRNVKFPKIKLRYKNVLKELKEKDANLAEFLVLSSYVHYTRVPLSFEMAYSYFSDRVESFEDIYELRDQLGDLLKDYSGEMVMDEDQDYYYPRSVYTAETILDITDSNLLKTVINNVLYNIPNIQINHYDVYRRRAYDKNIISKAFLDWHEGKEFYEQVFDSDFKNPYILQQGALYLMQKRKFTEAFYWIDKAITMTNNKYFSIRNSHAIILFEANINSKEESREIRSQLDKSMGILDRCYSDDKRRTFHAIRYGEQAIQYNDRYFDAISFNYLNNALKWLNEEQKRAYWNRDIFYLLKKINERLKVNPSK
jgi:hypothetical protein